MLSTLGACEFELCLWAVARFGCALRTGDNPDAVLGLGYLAGVCGLSFCSRGLPWIRGADAGRTGLLAWTDAESLIRALLELTDL